MLLGVNADDGHGAGGQSRGAQISGGKGLALALIVHRGVGDNGGSAGKMRAFHAQVAEIFGFHVGHG